MAIMHDDALERRLLETCDRIERLEARILPLLELKEDLAPITSEAMRTLVVELDDLDGRFETADALRLLKRLLRDIRPLTRMLERLEAADELVADLGPIAGEATKAVIAELGEMEREGLFKTLTALRNVVARFSGRYTPDRVEQLGEGLVDLVAVLERALTPQSQRLLRAAAEVVGDPSRAPGSVSMLGLFSMMREPDTRRGMALLLEVCRAVGRAAAHEDPPLLP